MSTLPAAVANAIKAHIEAGAANRGFFGHPNWYPIQFKVPPSGETNYGKDADEERTAVYYGELRGFYPSIGGYFQPWNSAYHPQAYTPPPQPPSRNYS